MKNIHFMVLILLFISVGVPVFAIEISVGDSARLDVVSRTTFGIDLDNPYRFGLSNELTQVDLVFNLAPYQKLSNRLNSPDAVGFIGLTLFHLDLIKTKYDTSNDIGYNAPDTIGTNRYQTGEFIAGIAKGPWLIQLNAAANEPFTSPWNKGMQFINDGFKFSWAYLDSMVDVRRILSIAEITKENIITKRGEENMVGAGQTNPDGHGTMKQYGFDTLGNIADRLGMNVSGEMIAAMYNSDNFGINFKFGTQYPFYDERISETNSNGLALGIDTVLTPTALDGLKVFLSLMGSYNWGTDILPDPVAAGTRIGYTIPLNEDISVEPWAGLDLRTRIKDEGGIEKFGYELSAGLTMRWPGQDGWLTDYIMNSDGRVFPGMSIGYKMFEDKENGKDMEHSLKFTLFEPRGDEGVFYGIGAEVIVDIIDITNVTFGDAVSHPLGNPRGGFSILVTSYVDYEINLVGMPGSLIPWTILYYDNLPGLTKEDERINDFKIDLGINLENAIANTTFGIVWNTGSLVKNASDDKLQFGYLRLIAEIRL